MNRFKIKSSIATVSLGDKYVFNIDTKETVNTTNVTTFDETDGHLHDMIEVTSDDLGLHFVDIRSYGGLQCKYDGNHPIHQEIEKRMFKITELIREIVELNKD